jgi:hypothetical protein
VHHEAVQFSNVAATQQFVLVEGGRYLATVVASNFGTVKLQVLGGDGSTYLDIKRSFDKPDGTGGTEEDLIVGTFAANGAKLLDLPPGSYQFAVASATAVYAVIARVPLA